MARLLKAIGLFFKWLYWPPIQEAPKRRLVAHFTGSYTNGKNKKVEGQVRYLFFEQGEVRSYEIVSTPYARADHAEELWRGEAEVWKHGGPLPKDSELVTYGTDRTTWHALPAR